MVWNRSAEEGSRIVFDPNAICSPPVFRSALRLVRACLHLGAGLVMALTALSWMAVAIGEGCVTLEADSPGILHGKDIGLCLGEGSGAGIALSLRLAGDSVAETVLDPFSLSRPRQDHDHDSIEAAVDACGHLALQKDGGQGGNRVHVHGGVAPPLVDIRWEADIVSYKEGSLRLLARTCPCRKRLPVVLGEAHALPRMDGAWETAALPVDCCDSSLYRTASEPLTAREVLSGADFAAAGWGVLILEGAVAAWAASWEEQARFEVAGQEDRVPPVLDAALRVGRGGRQ